MALSKKPVNGMKDILPEEMQIRDYVQQVIKETYRNFGFTQIETPCMENIANLSSKQGGENEKLIFKVMKRGEKLKIAEAKDETDLVDFGMRYDLTVPLVRYYSNNANDLPSPFKALQMGNVWRADRPQRGRYRQFMQCDIDIIGEPSNLAEIELILATTTTIGKLGFKNFEIRINERRILKAMAAYSGFAEEDYDTVFIILDKMDKIGLDGVAEELEKEGYAKESIEKYLALFKGVEEADNGIKYLAKTLEGYLDPEVESNLLEIIDTVEGAKAASFKMVFDPTLVRGMSYYTGTIFEISMPELGAACGGGGRYDKMVGKFTGQDVPACGFSIGFERIVLLLMESGFTVPMQRPKVAYLIEKGYPADKNTTWGELFEHFDKEGFDTLPAEIQEQLKADLLSDDIWEEPDIQAVAPVYSENTTEEEKKKVEEQLEQSVRSSSMEFFYNENESPEDFEDASLLSLDLLAAPALEDAAIEYMVSFSSEQECPTAVVIVALQDKETGSYLACNSTCELEDHTNGSGKTYSIGGLTDVFADLQTSHEYKVQAIAIATPPEGYLLTAPLYAGAELTAK